MASTTRSRPSRSMLTPLACAAALLVGAAGCDPLYLIEPSNEETATVHEGAITADETWRADDNPHKVIGSLVVAGPNGPTLTLEPGVRVLFARGASLVIGSETEAGSLHAVGSGDRIELLSQLQYQFHGYWGGIHFSPTAGESTLDRVTIRDCGGNADWPPACVRMIGSSAGRPHPMLKDVRIAFSGGYGVAAVGGTGLGAGSGGLEMISVRDYPFRVDPDRVHTLPAGTDLTAVGDVAVEVGGGAIVEDRAWPDLGLPYVITGSVRIRSDAGPILTIPAGARLIFGRNGEIVAGVNQPGGLMAEGTADDPIVFTGAGGAPRSWRGLTFGAFALPESRISNATIEFGGYPTGYSVANVTFFADVGPVVRNSTIRRSSGCGVARLAFGVPWVTDFTDPTLGNTFSDNTYGPQCTES